MKNLNVARLLLTVSLGVGLLYLFSNASFHSAIINQREELPEMEDTQPQTVLPRRKAFSLLQRIKEKNENPTKVFPPSIEAHRGGASIGVENSMRLFERVINQGLADSIQLDIYMTKDDQLIVSHPDDQHTLHKYGIESKKYIKDFTTEELQKIDIGQGHHMPLLQEVLNLTRSKIFVSIEIKEKSHIVVQRTLQLIHAKDVWEWVGVSSFQHSNLERAKQLMETKYSAHALELIYLCMGIPTPEEVKEMGATTLGLDYKLPGLTQEYIKKMHSLGVVVGVWPWIEEYGPDEKDYSSTILRNFDAICCNNPILMREAIQARFPVKMRRDVYTLEERISKVYIILEKLQDNPDLKLPPMIQAHRGGWSLGVENTLPLIRKAISLEFIDSIQFDVCQTRDGVVVVIHPDKDHYMKKFGFNDGRMMHDFLFQQIAQINYEGNQIPTLQEVFAFCKDRIFLNVELKSQEKDFNSTVGVKTLELIDAMNMWSQVSISSFRLFLLDTIKQEMDLNPKYAGRHLKLQYLFEAQQFPSLELIEKLRPSSINLNFASKPLNPEFIKSVHALGVGVHIWFKVKTPELDEALYEEAVKLGPDIICSNQPVKLRYIRDQYFNV